MNQGPTESSLEHTQILELIEQVRKDLEFHIAEAHAELVHQTEMRLLTDRVDKVTSLADHIVEAIKGTVMIDPITGEETRVGGMESKIDELYQKAIEPNPVKLPWQFWAAVVPVLITGVVGVVTALINGGA